MLAQIEGRLSFIYTNEWLNNPAAIPLSISLPLQVQAFGDQAARPFFAGLLPEGEQRKMIARTLQVSRQNDFALLDAIGGECAGAVTLLEPGHSLPQITDANTVRWFDDDEIIRLLDELPRRPMLAGEAGVRLSLAGAQDKLPVVIADDKDGAHDDGRIGLPLNGSPSSHILKPPISTIEDSVINEGFCMALAASIKLDVAKTQIRHVAGRSFLLVERYDRRLTPQRNLERLHQEDFCQALGIAPEYKYQNEDGPDLARCFDLLRRATRPSATNILRLLDFVIFNALIGNHDAHAKNFSLLYSDKGLLLAPLYDVLSTAIYPNLAPKMAMKVGSKYRFSEVQTLHWEAFAQQARLSPAQVRKRIIQLAQQLPLAARRLQTSPDLIFANSAIVEQIATLIEQRAALTMHRLTT